jgi:membrane associated rhomboid family serine protease
MIPLRDTVRSRTFPFVTVALIAVNVLVFLEEISFGRNLPRLIDAFGFIPSRFIFWSDMGRAALDPMRFVPLFTAAFLHGGWAHLLGNMWFLWIFGDNVEDRMGHARYLVFYLVTGIIASLSHVVMNLNGPSSLILSLGASGEISGVMGAYLALCPSRHVQVLMLRVIVEVPGYMAVGLWFLFQLISGIGLLGGGSGGDGVAYAAHVGGFVAGVLLARPFLYGRAQPQQFRSSSPYDIR